MDTNTICYTSWCILMFFLLQYVHEITTLSYGFIYPFQLKATQAGFSYAPDITSNSDSFHNFLKLKLMTTRIPTPRKLMMTCFQPFTAKKKFRMDSEQVPNSPIFTPSYYRL